jgi:hypothetical protein
LAVRLHLFCLWQLNFMPEFRRCVRACEHLL